MKVQDPIFSHGPNCRKMFEKIQILQEISDWARRYSELYETGPARNTIANNLARLFTKLDKFIEVN